MDFTARPVRGGVFTALESAINDMIIQKNSSRQQPRPPAGAAIATLCLVLGLWGCAGGPAPAVTIPERPLGRDVPVYLPSSGDAGRPTIPALQTPTDSISLGDAIRLALLNSPELATFAWEIRAREARILQAGRAPNPVLGVEAEDFNATGLRSDVPDDQQAVQPQTTVRLSQLVELGGKRTARRNLASRDRDLAAWDYEAARIDILTRVTHAFIDVVVAQEMVTLSAQTAEIVNRVQQSVRARVIAGVVSPIEETRADVALASASVEANRAVRSLEAARRRLASLWGAHEATFSAVAGRLDIVPALPSLSELTTRLADNPDLARWATELLQREAAVAAEASKRIPDVTVAGGYRRFTDLGSNAAVIGLSIPLPVFDRNSDAVKEAESRLAQAHEERRAVRARVSAALAEAYGRLAGAHAEVTVLRATVLPGTRETFEAVSEGYRLGKFSYLDVLDAQRTLIAANGQHLRALSEYHKAVADVERLVGAPLTDVSNAPR